jgi:hypothetical protein
MQKKTPGVYINEPDSFPPAIVAVATAVPAFIGYTEQAIQNLKSVKNTPVRIGSLADYRAVFGQGYQQKYYLAVSPATVTGSDHVIGTVQLYASGTAYDVVEYGATTFNLYNSLRLFFANGGGDCYIVSCGGYESSPGTPAKVSLDDLTAALATLADVVGPTMLVVPDAELLNSADYGTLASAMLDQCHTKRDRVAIFDVPVDPASTTNDPIGDFRSSLAATEQQLCYGMAYYPNLLTSVVQSSEVDISNFDPNTGVSTLIAALKEAAAGVYPPSGGVQDPRNIKLMQYISDTQAVLTPPPASGPPPPPPPPGPPPLTAGQITNALTANLPGFGSVLDAMAASQNILPPSGAMAGIYTQNDSLYGVWNAPANVGIVSCLRPVTPINDDQQQDMNVPVDGKAVNAIRTFVGRGTLVWGARTLDGNSADWRYIQVRRTMIFIEQSVKDALTNFVFAPNTAQTWVTVVSMIESFLHGVWAAGGLMGSSPAEAFSVQCGVPVTMTADDILNGNMRVQITLQMVHPAEFIMLTFQQQMAGGA